MLERCLGLPPSMSPRRAHRGSHGDRFSVREAVKDAWEALRPTAGWSSRWPWRRGDELIAAHPTLNNKVAVSRAVSQSKHTFSRVSSKRSAARLHRTRPRTL